MKARKLDPTKRSNKAKLLKHRIQERIIGQSKAVDAVTNMLTKVLSGFYDPRRPIGTMLFMGPTGTGKTMLCEAIAESLWGNCKALTKIDCGEYQHSHEIAKLVGSPPGYLGHRETHPALSKERINAFRTDEFNFSVIMFDEIEKASDALWNLLLGILDKGVLTLGTNEQVDMTKCLIIMTSNVGAKELAKMAGEDVLGFVNITDILCDHGKFEEVALAALRKKFSPEFINRIDDVVMFETLSKEQILEIIDLELKKIQSVLVLNEKFLTVEASPAAKAELVREGYDKRYNARNLKRAMEQRIVFPLSAMLDSGEIKPGDGIVVDFKEGEGWSYWAEPNPLVIEKLATPAPKEHDEFIEKWKLANGKPMPKPTRTKTPLEQALEEILKEAARRRDKDKYGPEDSH